MHLKDHNALTVTKNIKGNINSVLLRKCRLLSPRIHFGHLKILRFPIGNAY